MQQDGLSDCILLAACGANELLPQSPHVPADVFTACLTTPIKASLLTPTTYQLLRIAQAVSQPPQLLTEVVGQIAVAYAKRELSVPWH